MTSFNGNSIQISVEISENFYTCEGENCNGGSHVNQFGF